MSRQQRTDPVSIGFNCVLGRIIILHESVNELLVLMHIEGHNNRDVLSGRGVNMLSEFHHLIHTLRNDYENEDAVFLGMAPDRNLDRLIEDIYSEYREMKKEK